MLRVYEWLFIILGPIALAFGSFAVAQGAWIGGLLVVFGLWWTISGFRRLRFWLQARRRRPLGRGCEWEQPGPVQPASSAFLMLGSRPVRLVGGSVLIAAGVVIIVAALAR
jgi:hypothetical protein